MDRRHRESSPGALRALRSRRHVLGAITRGTAGGLGAALLARGLGGGNALSSAWAPGASTQDVTACPPAAEVLVRQEISTLTDAQLESLRRGVATMKQRSVDDPNDETGWLFQANLHGRPGVLSVSTWCQHNSWFFFPWHRMYVYWFERILRNASGDPALTLPYWNYSDDPAKRALPRALGDELDAFGNPNALFEPRRAPGINDGSVELTPAAVVVSLDNQDFFPPVDGAASFGGNRQIGAANRGTGAGLLEGSAHNNVHGEVGGSEGMREFVLTVPTTINYHCEFHPEMTGTVTVVDDPTLPVRPRFISMVDFAFFPSALSVPVGTPVRWVNMGDTDHTVTLDDLSFSTGPIIPNGYMALSQLSSRDPVFWLHHANIDRLWERWLAEKGDRRNPTDQSDWMDQEFTFFDVDGAAMPGFVNQFLDTKCLGYRYDDPLTEFEPDVPPDDGATPVAIVAAAEATVLGESQTEAPIEIGAEPVTTAVELAPPAAAALAAIAAGAATPIAGARAPSLSLTLEGIQNLAAPSITFAVYVNLPPDVEPDPASDSFVGSLYLFATFLHDAHGMGEQGMQQTFDITRAVQASQGRADAPSGVTVTIIPIGADRALALLATPVAGTAAPFADAARGPWVSIERMTVTAIE